MVLLNLLKNGAEAIDSAKMPTSRRHIELRVIPRHTPEEGGVIEFSVTDMGPGLPEEVIARLYEAFFSTKANEPITPELIDRVFDAGKVAV